MKRIVMIVFRLFFHLPGLIARLLRYGSNTEKYPLTERYNFVRSIVEKAVKKGNITVRVSGEENIPEKNGFVIYANHQGMFDPLAVIYACPKPISIVAKIELEKVPVLRTALKAIETLYIDRDDLKQSMKVILQMTKDAKNGKNYLIFPEGTRSRNGNEMLEMKGGSFKAAMKAKVPVVPVAVIDTYKVFDNGSTEKVEVQTHILKPISYDEYQDMKSTELAAEVQRRISEAIAAGKEKA